MSNKKSGFSTKGYYIALVLCAAAIGVSGFLYYRGSNANSADVPAAMTQAVQEDAAVGATRPAAQENNPVSSTAQTEPGETAPKQRKTMAPVAGEPVTAYSMECLSYNATTRDWRVHAGCDYAAQTGTEVKAAADGEVYTVYEDAEMGTTVVIRHDDGYTTHYSSLSESVAVQAGDRVSVGQTIGTVGSTALMESALGDHVCFRVTRNGETVDPAEFLN